ncbi:hypothetical protein GCM10027048_20030 [Hymenobacter coalescens]
MLLTKLTIKNFKCHDSLVLNNLDPLCIIIGENDCGKTIVLDAIEALLSPQPCKADDYRTIEDIIAEKVELIGDFVLDHTDTLPEHLRRSATHFRLTKICTKSSTRFFVDGDGYDHDGANSFHAQTVPVKQEILASLGVAKPAKTIPKLQEQFNELVEQGVLKKDIRSVFTPYADIRPFLPRVERFSSEDYTDPQTVIQRGLKSVALSVMKPLDTTTGEHVEVEELQQVRFNITAALDDEIRKAKETISRIIPGLETVNIIPTIDFGNALTNVQLAINAGSGRRNAALFGQGTNRRLWLGLLDWQRQVERENAVGGVIYLYDEPETNLHYNAQQQLFKHISDRSRDAVPAQSIVCTHSVHLIDRAPADAILLLEGIGASRRQTRRIDGDTAENMRTFFDRIGRNLGLSNTALLYEKAFLVVEGATEDEALPILYHTLYGRTPAEDGIVLVNLYSCSAWPTAMRILLKSRQEFVQMLLDQDCTSPHSSADLTIERLVEEGCSETFLVEQISFVGTKEYEDAFSNEVILAALNDTYHREDGRAWNDVDIEALRLEPKFSDAVMKSLKTHCQPILRSKATKPKIAVAVASKCTAADVPTAIKQAFYLLRRRAGLESTVTTSPVVLTSSPFERPLSDENPA